MRAVLPIIIAALLISSCGRKEGAPSGILPADKMQALLWDMMRADQFIGDYVVNIDSSLSRKDESIGLYREILDLHRISQEEFRESFYYYRARPELMKVIMDSISKRKLHTVDPNIPQLAVDTLPTGEKPADTTKKIIPREPIQLQ